MNRYKLLILAFPHAWRESYQDELLDLVEHEAPRQGQAIDLVRAGLRERLRASTPASTGALLASMTACGSLLLCWSGGTSPQTQSVRWPLTAAFLALLFWWLGPRRVRFASNRLTPVALQRVLTGAFIAVSAASTGAAINSNASSHSSKPSSRFVSAQQSMPTSPSIRSTISTQVAATPQIVAYLQSSQPKSVEWINGQTVWVGTGSPARTSQNWPYSQKGHTIAGTYQALPFSNNAPANWSTEPVASASAGS